VKDKIQLYPIPRSVTSVQLMQPLADFYCNRGIRSATDVLKWTYDLAQNLPFGVKMPYNNGGREFSA
jgi:hypothetical protein